MGIVSIKIIGIVDIRTKQVTDHQIQSEIVTKVANTRFRLLESGFNDYQFKSSDGKRLFANGGDISILHNFIFSPEDMREILEANCTKKRKDYSVEQSFELDENGQRIKERCVIVHRSGEARIIWTESKTEYWTIDATSLSLAKEVESSETFRLVKSRENSKQE